MEESAHRTPRPAAAAESAAELAALEASQRELWATLRDEDDPEVRMALLSAFSENRTAIARLRDQLGVDDARPGGPVYQVELVGEQQPAPRPSRLPRPEDPAAQHPPPLPPGVPEGGAGDRPAFIDPPPAAPTQRRREPAPPAEPSAGVDPASAGQAGHGAPGGVRSSSDRMTRASSFDAGQLQAVLDQIPARTYWLVGGAVAVLAVLWLIALLPFGGGGGDMASEVVAGPVVTTEAESIGEALHRLGYGDVAVSEDGDIISLAGVVESADDKASVVGAARALSDGRPVDDSALTIEGDETATSATVAAIQGAAPSGGRPGAMQAELDRVVASTPIIFGSSEADLSALHIRILNSVASILLAYADIPVDVVGFTDGTGANDANRDLSLRRAQAVKDYLVSQGVPESSLTVRALGEDTATGSRAIASLERRVEFEVAATGSPALAQSDQPLRIAVVAPSARNDLAFTQSMVDAVDAIAEERGNVEVAVTDGTFVPDEAAEAIRAYADQGYDLVIAHGSQFGAPLIDIATDYPDVAFAWGTASDTFDLPNVYAYDAAAGEGGFVLGAMAALLSQTGVAGVVGPIEVGDAQKYVNGFVAGARVQKADMAVPVIYTGSFSDLTLAAESAQAHVDAGADVMTGSAQMVVGAVAVADEADALWFGTQANQTELAPDLVVASQVYHWEVILRQIIADIDGGAVAGRFYTANLANGGLVIEYNSGYPLPDAVRARADELVAGIISGSVKVSG
ncbi:MAG: BMP family ABC transporter substrate-binding protein [Actinomycetota bacterium]